MAPIQQDGPPPVPRRRFSADFQRYFGGDQGGSLASGGGWERDAILADRVLGVN